MLAPENPDLVARLKGVIMFNAPTYKAIAEDTSALPTAAIIVVVAALASGVGAALGNRAGGTVGVAVMAAVLALIGWLLGAWLLAFIARRFFNGDTDTNEMLRVNGYTRIFGVLSILSFVPVIGPLVGIAGAVLGAIGNVIGIREAAGFDTQKAVLTAIIAAVAVFVIIGVLTVVATAVFVGASIIGSR